MNASNDRSGSSLATQLRKQSEQDATRARNLKADQYLRLLAGMEVLVSGDID